ncbi:MAG TPA: hypothetical protein VMU47_06725 [Caldimonas sp.]|nr:hypothetical protein [Caldimonas sp.]
MSRQRTPPLIQRAELAWEWPEIVCVLLWKLKPLGCTVTHRDLNRLPRDRVLIEKRTWERITYRWGTWAEAEAAARAERAESGQKAGLEEAQGRWQKLAGVILWKWCKTGTTALSGLDQDAVPPHLVLLQRGYRNGIEFLWVTRAEAARLERIAREHDNRRIVEAVRRH